MVRDWKKYMDEYDKEAREMGCTITDYTQFMRKRMINYTLVGINWGVMGGAVFTLVYLTLTGALI